MANDQPKTTREDVINLFIRRERMWLDASVAIANTLPAAWDIIEDFLAEQNMVNLLLVSLKIDPVTEVIEYGVAEQGRPLVVTLPIPLSLAVNPENGLAEYIRSLPTSGDPFNSDSDLDQLDTQTKEDIVNERIRSALEDVQLQHPTMFMDIDRLVQIERDAKDGAINKHAAVTTTQ